MPKIRALIPTALELWAANAFSDLKKREQLKKTITAALTAGVLDLTNYVNGTTERINLKDLRTATVYLISADATEVFLRSFSGVTVVEDAATVYAAGAGFSASDVGNRIVVSDGTVLLDGHIDSVEDAQNATADVNATGSSTFAEALIYGTELSGAIENTFIWLGSFQQLRQHRKGGFDQPACYLEGYTLRTRGTDGSLTSLATRSIRFTVPVYPSTVTLIPTTLQKDFISFAADFVREKLLV